MDGIRSGPGEGERFEDDIRVALIKGALPHVTVLEFIVDGEGYDGPDPHTHSDHTDSFYVPGGELELTLGDETFRAGPGTFAAAPPGVRHGFKVPRGAGGGGVLEPAAPGGVGDR